VDRRTCCRFPALTFFRWRPFNCANLPGVNPLTLLYPIEMTF
jgi:hypothetical protein